MHKIPALLASLGFAILFANAANAESFSSPASQTAFSGNIVTVAGGCGPNSWRGPWGHCRDTPYSGPLPGGGWAGGPQPAADYFGNGCPPGYWHGPWGHCRDTPYQGRLPDGSWK